MPSDAQPANNLGSAAASTTPPSIPSHSVASHSATFHSAVPARISITTEDGLILRAESLVPNQPIGAVVLCHPHPMHGGNMFASVIDSLFQSLGAQGFACLRFNFRGVTGSDGRHDYGDGEQLDVIAAVDHLSALTPGLPLTLAGWSFGADVSLGVRDPAIKQWFCVAPPLSVLQPEQMGAGLDRRAIHLVVPERDQFCDPATATERTKDWQNTTLTIVPGADHFLTGQLDFVTDLAARTIPRR